MNQLESVTSFESRIPSAWPRRWWVNFLCALATLVTTTLFGSALVTSFRSGRPLDPDLIWPAYWRFFGAKLTFGPACNFQHPCCSFCWRMNWATIWNAAAGEWMLRCRISFHRLPFSELSGHSFESSRPFLPAAAFSILVSPGRWLAFAMLLPFLIVGVALSHPLPVQTPPGPFIFSAPLAVRLLEMIFFPNVLASRIVLHPMAMAAWAGLLATAINLLPLGQLDGGHLVYATLGPRLHRTISTVFVGVLFLLGFWYWTWWAWAVVLFFFGRRHPLVYDSSPINKSRRVLAAVVCLLFLLSFSVVPVRVGF